MKILLVNFDLANLDHVKDVIKQSKLSKCKIFESLNLEEAKKSSNWDEIDFIICKNDSEKCRPLKSNEELNIPILFLTDEIISIDDNYSNFNDIPNYLPISEVTTFTLEKFITNSIVRRQYSSKVKELENIRNDASQKEEKFKDLFDNPIIGMYEIDKDGNFILANQVFLEILGLDNKNELDEFNAFEKGISTNGKREKLKELLKEREYVHGFEDEWLKADKTKIVVRENILSKKDTSGNIKYYQGIVEDITERKKVEVELIRSKKDAEKSDKLKSEFLTQISHEIRTPVNTLLSFANLVKEDLSDSLSEELKDCFGHMSKAGNRIIRTIDLIIKMSELHTENYEPEFTENNLITLLEELIGFYKPLAEQKDIELQFVKGVDNANLKFDKQTIYDVFSNIIDNAIKYTDSGSIKVYIKKSLLNKVSVTVIDTGIGISEDYLGDMFRPFSQETTGYTRKFDGNGLGLALVKEYCDLNNAEIFVSSEKGSGSNFTIVFK